MNKIFRLPVNYGGKGKSDKPQSRGGATIAHGCTIRWRQDEDAHTCSGFGVYRNISEVVTVRISHNRELDTYQAHDAESGLIVSGTIEQVFAAVDRYLVRAHREASALPPDS